MGEIAENYLSASIAKITRKIRISETMAGATLLAFANGGIDVIAAFTAEKTPGGIPLIVGSIYGSGLFDFSLTAGLVVMAAREIHLVKKHFWKDVGFYLLATVYLIGLGIYGWITPLNISGFFVIYIVYLIVIILMEKKIKQEEASIRESIAIPQFENQDINLIDETQQNPGYEFFDASLISKHGPTFTNIEVIEEEEEEEKKVSSELQEPLLSTAIMNNNEDIDKFIDVNLGEIESIIDEHSRLSFHDNSVETPKSLRKLMKVVNYPLRLLCKLTMPAIEERQWNKNLAMIHPFTTVWLVLFSNGLFFTYFKGLWLGTYFIPFQLLLSYIILKNTSYDRIHNWKTFAAVI